MDMQKEFSLLLIISSIPIATTQARNWTREPPSEPPSHEGEINIHHIAQPYSFSDAITVHKRICSHHQSCSEPEPSPIAPSCCGSCSCDFSCEKHGSCCLERFPNFAEAPAINQMSRYDCVLMQHFSPEETDYSSYHAFSVISKCDPEYEDQKEIDKCRNPDPDLASVVPVTESATNYRHFKNKHCAFCNFVDKNSPLIYWKLQIQSNHLLKFPKRNLLQELKKTRGNIFFKSPKYLLVYECDLLIDTCNVTGRWGVYNGIVKKACESYNDPFNFTYKNVFCYMCNEKIENIQTGLKKDTRCQNKFDIPETPQFSAILDIEFVKEGHSGNHLICEDDELQDHYLKVCRRVYCHEDGVLFKGTCIPGSKLTNVTCFNVFIKLVPVVHTLKVNKIDKLLFAEDLSDNDSKDFPDAEEGNTGNHLGLIIETDIYFKTDKNDFIEYAVVLLVKEFGTRLEKDAFLNDILKQPRIRVSYIGEMYVLFDLEPALYNITVVNGQKEIQVPASIPDLKFDRLVSEFRYVLSDSNTCSVDKMVTLTKVHKCPFIKLHTDEIGYDIKNGFLLLGVNLLKKTSVKILSQWEYEIHDNFIFICLQDYLDIYNSLTLSDVFVSSVGAAQPLSGWYLPVFTCFLYI